MQACGVVNDHLAGCFVRAEVERELAERRYPRTVDERALSERLITYDTSTLEGMQARPASSRAGSRPGTPR